MAFKHERFYYYTLLYVFRDTVALARKTRPVFFRTSQCSLIKMRPPDSTVFIGAAVYSFSETWRLNYQFHTKAEDTQVGRTHPRRSVFCVYARKKVIISELHKCYYLDGALAKDSLIHGLCVHVCRVTR